MFDAFATKNLRIVPTKSWLLPRRIFFQWKGRIALCDYIMPYETLDVKHSFFFKLESYFSMLLTVLLTGLQRAACVIAVNEPTS